MGFTIYERDFYTNEYRLYKETIFSDNIFHGDDLRIHQLCNTKGPIGGGTKVHILIKLQSGYVYFVRMFRYNKERKLVDWEKFVEIKNDDIFSNAAITYTLPPGPENVNTDEIEVMIEVVVNRSTYRSKGVKFWYLNTNDSDNGRRKRARTHETSNTTAVVTEVVTLPTLFDAINPREMHYNRIQPVSETDPNLQDASAVNSDTNISYLLQHEAQCLTANSDDTMCLENLTFLHVDQLQIEGSEQSLIAANEGEVFAQGFNIDGLELFSEPCQEPRDPVYYSRDRCESVSTKNETIVIKETSKRTIDISLLIKQRIDEILKRTSSSDIGSINIKGLNSKSEYIKNGNQKYLI